METEIVCGDVMVHWSYALETWTRDEAAQGSGNTITKRRCLDGAGGQSALTMGTVVRRCPGEPAKRPTDHRNVVSDAGNLPGKS